MGKELAARAIHYPSGRAGRFVAVNCASVSDSLFESEFFGHRRGAFTGALADRFGLFQQADSGTLLLGRGRRHAAEPTGEAAPRHRGP